MRSGEKLINWMTSATSAKNFLSFSKSEEEGEKEYKFYTGLINEILFGYL